MHYTKAIAALTALSTVSSAKPIRLETRQGKASIQQVASGYKLSGPEAYRKALLKYGAQVPTTVRLAADAQQSGSVGNNPTSNDEQYVCPVSLGGQTLNLDFDTGSADLWAFSTELPSSESSGHTLWNPSGSQKLSGETWQISYGDGSGASGDVYSGTVVVGGVTATSQAIEAAQSVSAQFEQDTSSDGLLGLAFSSINTCTPQQETTFFDTVKSSLASPLFTATLKHQQPGSYDFGYIDSSKYQGSLVYADVDSSQGFWSFPASSSLGGSFTGIADTGTTLMLVSDDIVSAYYAQVSGAQNSQSQGGYVFPCSTTPPDFPITISGANFVVPGAYINYAAVGDGTCFGGVQSSQGIGFNILGDVFLKNLFVVFDSEGPRLGFATQAGGQTGGGSGGNGTTNGTIASWHRARTVPTKLNY